MTVRAIPIYQDNYVWLIEQQGTALVVDPGDATPVLAYLRQHQLSLKYIVVTHHHWDHVTGIPELVAAYPEATVYGPQHPKIPSHHLCQEGDQLQLPELDRQLQVIAVPGHTLAHVAYYDPQRQHLFCGDSLFSAGCGRMFEGQPAQYYASIQRLAQLPDECLLYCTHEYTLANLAFAAAVEPDNRAVQRHQQYVTQLRQSNQPSLPSTLGREREINPFLRCGLAQVRHSVSQQAQQPLTDEVNTFAALRRWKDQF